MIHNQMVFPGVRVMVLGGHLCDFSLPWLSNPQTETDNSQKDKDIYNLLRIANRFGVSEIIIPRLTDCNQKIVDPECLPFVKGVTRPHIRYTKSKPTDGVCVPKGAVALMRSADCPTIIVRAQKAGKVLLLAVHGGRSSLLNLSTKRSVVDEIMDNSLGGVDPRDVSVHIACGISGKHFDHPLDHPRFGDQNKDLIDLIRQKWDGGERQLRDGLNGPIILNRKKGFLDLPRLIAAQFSEYGITVDQISRDGLDTATDDRLSSHRHEKCGRNAIIVGFAD